LGLNIPNVFLSIGGFSHLLFFTPLLNAVVKAKKEKEIADKMRQQQ